VLWNNTVIFKNEIDTCTPEGRNCPVIVYHIHGNHAFFYDEADARKGAVHLRTGPPQASVKADADPRLRVQKDDHNRVPFEHMEEYSLAGLKAQIEDGKNKTFYCFDIDIKAAKKEIEEADIKIWTGIGNTPESITSLHVCRKNKQDKTDIIVKAVPKNAFDLFKFCEILTDTTKYTVEYFGEGQSVVPGLPHTVHKPPHPYLDGYQRPHRGDAEATVRAVPGPTQAPMLRDRPYQAAVPRGRQRA
jgi:hypothetical protein